MIETGQILLVLALAAPLAAVMLVPIVGQPLRILPWAAAPGLAAALTLPGMSVELPMFVLGLTIQLDRTGAMFLGYGSLVWCLAGAYARHSMANADRAPAFCLFWLLTLAGALGTFVAADVVSFYVAFSLMSLATYGLVIHDRTASARRAGLIYIVLAVLGETLLGAAFMLAVSNAESTLFTDVHAALATSQWSNYVFAGLLVGFGIKVGLVPLHVWLPLAHPEAPTPASAVLSGIIVKAGIIGLIRILPADSLSPLWRDVLVGFGLFTAYYGVIVGLMQSDAKAILAYSTLSQMGIVFTVLVTGLGGPDAAHTINVTTLYAIHHGLAKSALFLAVGVVAICGGWAFRSVMVATALTALAIAGLPLSGGALAKLAIKDVLGEGPEAFLVALSAIGTTLLMLRFLYVLAQKCGTSTAAPAWGLVLPWAGIVFAAVTVPWMIFSELSGTSAAYALSPANIWSGLWPILLALVPAIIAIWRWPAVRLTVPQGDIVVLVEPLVRRIGERAAQASVQFSVPRVTWIAAPLGRIDAAERALRSGSTQGPILVIVVILIVAVLAS